MSVPDAAYTSLLSHLHNPTSSLSFSTIQAALAHHLASLSPLPTPLAATVVSSRLYLSPALTNAKLQSLSTAFRHATHLKFRTLREAAKERSRASFLFRKSVQASTRDWVQAVVTGVQGGHPVLRLACCSGLLLGVQDLEDTENAGTRERVDVGNVRGKVEDELVLAVAEVIDLYANGYVSGSSGAEEWEKEFQLAGQDILFLALISVSQSLPLVDQCKLKALPLPILARVLTSTVSSTFAGGSFLSTLSASVTTNQQYSIYISASSPLSLTLQSLSSSPLMTSIASVSKLTATILALLLDATSASHVKEGLRTAASTLDTLRDMARRIELDWNTCALASAKDQDIAPESRDIAKSVWTILKTLLFSSIMLTDAILSSVVYIPLPSYISFPVSPSSLALQALRTHSHLSFVISQFGGVTSTSQGFEELKKTFYLSLDILTQGDLNDSGDSGAKANAYVRESCLALREHCLKQGAPSVTHAKEAYVLASIEQLVPVLSESNIKDWVWGVCFPHLSDPSHRETYESAHSVVLSIFASNAQQQQLPDYQSSLLETKSILLKDRKKPMFDQQPTGRQTTTTKPEVGDSAASEEASAITVSTDERKRSANFVEKMVPFYAQCLIENSADGKLSTPQLQLAYAALVRSASGSAISFDVNADETYALAWYCIEILLETIWELFYELRSQERNKVTGRGEAHEDGNKPDKRLHRLHLMLISTVSSLPLPLMLRVLEQIRIIMTAYPRADSGAGVEGSAKEGGRKDLVQALFSEILEKVGDREKETGMRWWYKYRPMLIHGQDDEEANDEESSATGNLKNPGKQQELKTLDVPEGQDQASGIISRL